MTVSDHAIRRVMGTIGDCYGKPGSWADRAFASWAPSLRELPLDDAELTTAVKAWCEGCETAPSLAAMLVHCKTWKSRNAPDTTTSKGCRACTGSGWRDVARHWTDDEGQARAMSCAAACDCAAGDRIAQGQGGRTWRKIVDAWAKLPSTTAVYFSSEALPILPQECCMTEAEWTAVLQRRAKAKGPRFDGAAFLARLNAPEDPARASVRAASIARDRSHTEAEPAEPSHYEPQEWT